MKIGAAGVVLDGVIRDSEEIRESGYPVFATGTSPNGPYKEGPGEINFSITCGDKVIDPGDVIVADSDGVVVVQKDVLAECIEKIKKIIDMETQIMTTMEKYVEGRPLLPNLNQILKNKGLE
jgi:regulator of RNase E activity RraA